MDEKTRCVCVTEPYTFVRIMLECADPRVRFNTEDPWSFNLCETGYSGVHAALDARGPVGACVTSGFLKLCILLAGLYNMGKQEDPSLGHPRNAACTPFHRAVVRMFSGIVVIIVAAATIYLFLFLEINITVIWVTILTVTAIMISGRADRHVWPCASSTWACPATPASSSAEFIPTAPWT